jgi:hypothetical protein
MTKFMVLYNSQMSAADVMANSTPEEMQTGMDAWMAWTQKNGEAIVDLGQPLEARIHLESGSSEAGSNQASGYSIMQADSLDALTKALEDHPHLHVPGNTIDVFEFLPMPGVE